MVWSRSRGNSSRRMNRLHLIFACALCVCVATPAVAQISFTTAIDLALQNSPKVLMAEANVTKAQAALAEVRDVYIPTLTAGSGLGYSYGFPVGQPTLFNVASQSLLLNYSQRDYLRAARSALDAANLSLKDARYAVVEDASITYIALDHDSQRQTVLAEQEGYAEHLVLIVQDRLDAGQDTSISVTTAKLTAAQIRLAKLRADDQISIDQDHLARLVGLPAQGLTAISNSIPSFAVPLGASAGTISSSSPGVEAAYATARAKQQTAFGDARYLWRPQIFFVAQYNYFSTFNNYQDYYLHFQQNNAGIGVQITLPIFDAAHRAKARESAADAVHAEREADIARDQFLEGRLKLEHSTAELSAQAEVATLDQQLAQQQLDVMLVQLKSGTGNPSGVQMSPKDEATARIAEREKFLAVLDADFQMRQAQISLLRQTGELESWIKSVAQTQTIAPKEP